MAGSQLKKLRNELKSKGLIGQTNTKSRNKKNKTPNDTRRSDRQEIISEIRNKFNVFDSRVNRVKRDVTTIENGKFVKVGTSDQSNPVKLNSFMTKNLKTAYDLHKKSKGKNGKLVDRRFGENSGLSQEEKMLQRFVKERESQSKRNKFSLESDEEMDDDDEEVDFTLTHSGKVLADEDRMQVDQPEEEEEEEVPGRKKSKAEVMKEIMAKSKFHKAERQKLFNKTQTEIENLDDNFQDIWSEIGATQGNQQFKEKKPEDISYDEKVRGLVYDKRAVPADKTKTEEEIQKEYNDKIKKLEDDRLKRMEGERDAEGDDLGEFWGEESDDESSGGQDVELEGEEGKEEVDFPLSYDAFCNAIEKDDKNDKGVDYINQIIKTYKPHLRQGNKERMNKFVSILFKYTINNPDDEIIQILKKLSESYNEELVKSIREEMVSIHERIINKALVKSDLVFFNLCGFIFSSSDKYHLIIIPNLILMNEILSTFVSQDINEKIELPLIGQCLFIVDSLLQYQRISKRFEPEINNCLIMILSQLVDQVKQTKSSDHFIALDSLFDTKDSSIAIKYVNKAYNLISKVIDTFKDYSAFKTIIQEFVHLLAVYKGKQIGDEKLLQNTINKLTRLEKNTELVPLTLQTHRKLAIKTLQPKFEDNFNPNKNYDLDLNKQEIDKMKKQFKKEKKETVKDIRRQNAFETNEKLSEKIKMYDEYHSKMANIVNLISTIEGKERNDYEKEKRRAAKK